MTTETEAWFKVWSFLSFTESETPSCRQLLCLVGEAFDDYSDDVCGAVVNIRNKGDKIAVWTSDYDNRQAVTHIGWCRFSINTHIWNVTKIFYAVFSTSAGEFTRNDWDFLWRWLSATSLTQTRLPKAVQPPRTNLSFEKRPSVPLFTFLVFICCRCIRLLCCKDSARRSLEKENDSSCQIYQNHPST